MIQCHLAARSGRPRASPMTDLQILLIGLALVIAFSGYVAGLRPGAAMNPLDVLALLAAAFVFVYLVWALLRPEDF